MNFLSSPFQEVSHTLLWWVSILTKATLLLFAAVMVGLALLALSMAIQGGLSKIRTQPPTMATAITVTPIGRGSTQPPLAHQSKRTSSFYALDEPAANQVVLPDFSCPTSSIDFTWVNQGLSYPWRLIWRCLGRLRTPPYQQQPFASAKDYQPCEEAFFERINQHLKETNQH